MAGRGRTPKTNRRNPSDKPIRGEWTPTTDAGWQHGAIPEPPAGLIEETRQAWAAWMAGWPAAHWIPGDVPGLRIVARLFDDVARGEFQRAGELRLWADTYGITPKGQQDRRWTAPEPAETPARRPDRIDQYAHLRPLSISEGNRQ